MQTETIDLSGLHNWSRCDQGAVRSLLNAYGLRITDVADGSSIPGSYWGDSEAGLKQNQLFVRADTPLHSLLHEACHAICMGPARRQQVDTDAGGDDTEENAVCYLQICLAEEIPRFSALQCCEDMDAWGYSFRLGSARSWFLHDAEDARQRLQQTALLPENHKAVIAALSASQC